MEQDRLDKRSRARRRTTHGEDLMFVCKSRLTFCVFPLKVSLNNSLLDVYGDDQGMTSPHGGLTPSLPTKLSVKMEVTGTEHRRAQTPVQAGPVLLAKAFQKHLQEQFSFTLKRNQLRVSYVVDIRYKGILCLYMLMLIYLHKYNVF